MTFIRKYIPPRVRNQSLSAILFNMDIKEKSEQLLL